MKLIKKYIFLIALFSVLIISFLFSLNLPLYDDEPRHFDQINLFIKGRYQIITTSIPAYHLLITQIAKLFHFNTVNQFRLINLFFSFLNIYIFFLIAKKISPANYYSKTIQFAFLPILFPYRFLLYSENLFLLFILCAFYFVIKSKYFYSFIFALLSVLTKQINIVWYIFIMTTLYYKENLFQINLNKIYKFISGKLYFFAGLLAFGIFVFFNHGVAFITQDVHPDFYVSPGNFYWTMILYAIIFLPLNITKFNQFQYIFRKSSIILLPVIIFLIIAMLTFKNDHPWNQYPEHLRNRILLFFMSGLLLKFIFFISVIFAIITISFIKLKKNYYYLLYPFMIISLVPIWLIESRYSLPFFVFFILFREDFARKYELLQSIYLIVISVLLFKGYLLQSFYL